MSAWCDNICSSCLLLRRLWVRLLLLLLQLQLLLLMLLLYKFHVLSADTHAAMQRDAKTTVSWGRLIRRNTSKVVSWG